MVPVVRCNFLQTHDYTRKQDTKQTSLDIEETVNTRTEAGTQHMYLCRQGRS